jgi:hypothetical protein
MAGKKKSAGPVLVSIAVRVDASTAELARALCTVIGVPLGEFAGRALKVEVDSILEHRDSEFRSLVDAVMKARETYAPEYGSQAPIVPRRPTPSVAFPPDEHDDDEPPE